MSSPLVLAAAAATTSSAAAGAASPASPSGSGTLVLPGAAAATALGHVNPFWVVVLVLGFPLLMLLLGEALRWLQRHQPAFVAPMAILRNWTLPALGPLFAAGGSAGAAPIGGGGADQRDPGVDHPDSGGPLAAECDPV
jgi:hypothetical protein